MTKSNEKKSLKDSNKSVKPKPESLQKITHLFLHDKYLARINNLAGYTNLTVLYLHNNQIQKIENISNLRNLVSLYLQKNKIRKIENLDKLVKLRRLFLGHNEISVVENLEKLVKLEEFHIEKQALDKSDSLCFDPRTVMYLSKTLQNLNISHNNLITIDNLYPLKFLKSINASNNKITDINNIIDAVKNWYYLEEATFAGNPLTKVHRYRETVIAKTYRLQILDNKLISDNNRRFIKRFEQEKHNFEQNKEVKLPKEVTSVTKNYPLLLQKAVSHLMLKPTPINGLQSISTDISTTDAYIPWRCFPKRYGSSTNIIPPLLMKSKKKDHVKKVTINSLPSVM